MAESRREQILNLREKGYSYGEIAKLLDTPIGTVRGYCGKEKRKANETFCRYCGKKLKQTKGHKQKTFCDEKCRYFWFKRNPQDSKPFYKSKCECCGVEFWAYGNSKRKFCSRECYLKVHSKKK